MNIKRYQILHMPTQGEITVDIDHDFTVPYGGKVCNMEEILKENLLFWASGEERIDNYDDNVTEAYLQLLCSTCMCELVENNWNVQGLIDSFKDKEGWTPVDGSFGIKIIYCEAPEMDYHDDYEIKEIPIPEESKSSKK